MIDLYTWPTPNGRKISILLEELNSQYKAIPIDIGNSEQFQKEFTKISPSNKIPAIFDHETQTSIFESGAIMLYLADKYDKFLPKKSYWITMEWFMFQLTQVGPILGQAHQFLFYHQGQGEFVENKYIDYAKRIYLSLYSLTLGKIVKISNFTFIALIFFKISIVSSTVVGSTITF